MSPECLGSVGLETRCGARHYERIVAILTTRDGQPARTRHLSIDARFRFGVAVWKPQGNAASTATAPSSR
jgi:hypothetical protein